MTATDSAHPTGMLSLVGCTQVNRFLARRQWSDLSYVGTGSQLCVGGETMGNTLIYKSDELLARACHAKLYKTREGYEKAKAKLQTWDQWANGDERYQEALKAQEAATLDDPEAYYK